MSKKLLFCLIVIVTFAFCLILPAGLIKTAEAGADPLTGSGTIEDPYVIHNGENLVELALKENFSTAYAELAANIEAPEEFNGFGTFGGNFDGKGYGILNFTLTSGEPYVGLFKQVTASGVIKNLSVEATIVSSSLNMIAVAGIVAGSSAGTITDVLTSGSITGNASVGGVAGAVTNGIVRAASSSVTLTGGLAGGIAGKLLGGTVEHCYTSGIINASSSGGGIIGDMQNGTLAYCYNLGAVNKVDPEDLYCYIGHIAGSSAEEFSDTFYFDVVDNSATQVVGAFGTGSGDLPGSGTLIDDITGKTSFVFTLNGFGEYWAVNQGANNGYPILRFMGEFVELSAVEKTYSYVKDTAQELEITAPGYEGNYTIYYFGETFNGTEYELSLTAPTNAGVYSYYAFPSTGQAIGCLSGSYTVRKANLTAQYSLEDKLGSTYTGATQTLEILDSELNPPDWADLGLDEPSYTYYLIQGETKTLVPPSDAKDVGTYEVVATIEGGNNYNNLTGDDALVATLEISKATLTMQADDKYAVYGGSIPAFTVSVTGFVANETPTTARGFVAPTAVYSESELPQNAGEYTKKIIIGTSGSSHNYSFIPAPNADPLDPLPEGAGTLYIAKADIAGAAFAGASYTYSNTAYSLSATFSAPVETSLSYAIDEAEPSWQSIIERSEAGAYRMLAKFDAGANYNVLILSAMLYINKANITGLNFSDVNVTYDGTAKEASLDTEFVHTLFYIKSGVPSEDAPIAAGVYPIYAEVYGGANYNDLRLDATLSINKMYVRVVAENVSTVYGEVLLDSFSVDYFDASGNPYVSVPGSLGAQAECVPSAAAGDYPITVSVTDTHNFDAVLIDGVYTVEKVNLVVTVRKEIIPYDTAIPAFTLNYSGFVASEDESVLLSAPIAATDAVQGADAGEYYVELSGGEAENYAFILMSGYQLIITKTDRSGIIFNSSVCVYDGLQKTISTNASGDYTVTYNDDETAPVGAGKYFAELYIPESRNYYSYSAAAWLTINKAEITVTCNFPVVTYGDPYTEVVLSRLAMNTVMTPELEASIDASFECAVNASNAATVDASSYPITISSAPNSNLNVTIVSGSYVINKALLTVTVISKTYKYNEDIQPVEFTAVGFKNGEDLSALTASPALSASPAKGDAVGVYPIYASNGQADNYSFKYIPGTVTINQASFADLYFMTDVFILYDGTPKILDLRYKDLSPGPVVLEPTFVKNVLTSPHTDTGEYNVIITVEDTAGNYEFMTFSAIMTILPRDLTVRGASAVNRVYNATTSVALTGGSLYFGDELFEDPSVQLQPNTGIMENKNVGNNKAVTTAMSLTGSGARNYNLIQPDYITVDIQKTVVTIQIDAVDRLYNGRALVALAFPFSEIPHDLLASESDSVSIDFSSSFGTVADPSAGTDKPVTPSIALSGPDSGNYSVQPSEPIDVDISAGSVFDVNTLYVGQSAVPLLDSEFDGIYNGAQSTITYNAPVSVFNGSPFILPLLSSDPVPGVSWEISGESATNAGIYTATIVITGSDNFLSETITVTYEIARRAVNISSLIASEKIYDGTNTATMLSYQSDILGTSDVTIVTDSAVFAGSNIGLHFVTFTLSLTGDDADSYYFADDTLESTAMALITTRTVTITEIAALSRIYDGTTTVTLEGGTLNNVINDEIGFTLGTGALASADIGENLAVTTSITLTGEKAINYHLIQPALTVNITPKALTITADSKIMTAKKALPVLTFTADGLIETEDLSGSLAVNTDGRKAGEYEITLGTLSAGDNYAITYISATLTVKTPAYVWVIVGLSSAIAAAGAGFGIFLFLKKKNILPLKKRREIY